MTEVKKVGLALSSGGSRGLAHIGVIETLEKNKIPIDLISGTSMGALVAALYAIEPNSKKIKADILKLKDEKFFDYTFPSYGLIKGRKVEDTLDKLIGKINFSDLRIPLYITAFDIEKEREVIFSKGSVAKAVRASISIPGVFIPVVNNNKVLVDGGVTDPVPTEILKDKGADIVIAVNVNFIKKKKPQTDVKATLKTSKKVLPSIYQSTMRSLQYRESEMSEADLFGNKADVIFQICLEKIDGFEFAQAKKIIEMGRKESSDQIAEIRENKDNPLKEFLSDEPKKEEKPSKLKEIVNEIKKEEPVKTIVEEIKEIKKDNPVKTIIDKIKEGFEKATNGNDKTLEKSEPVKTSEEK